MSHTAARYDPVYLCTRQQSDDHYNVIISCRKRWQHITGNTDRQDDNGSPASHANTANNTNDLRRNTIPYTRPGAHTTTYSNTSSCCPSIHTNARANATTRVNAAADGSQWQPVGLQLHTRNPDHQSAC